MPVERYTVGRASYNRRERISVGMGAEDAEALRDALCAMIGSTGPEGRIQQAVRWAGATLELKNMPLDPNAPIYSEKDWCRKNERSSAEWYAIRILHNAEWMLRMIAKGDALMAADFALDLGHLITERHFIFNVFVQQGRNGAAETKLSDWRRKVDDERQKRRKLATKAWDENPNRTQRKVASLIDPDPSKHRNIIRDIRDLDPKLRQTPQQIVGQVVSTCLTGKVYGRPRITTFQRESPNVCNC